MLKNLKFENQGFIMIKATQISKTYGNVIALKDTDCIIQKDELIAITGPSGAGKSTLLHLLSGLEPSDTGSIYLNGKKIQDFSKKEMQQFRNESLGFVFQFHYLLPEFSAIENVMLSLLIGGVNEKEAEAKAKIMLERVGLSHRLTHKPNAMSGGEQQRVAVARAVVNEPKLLFADEPTGNLDSKTTDEVFDLFLKLKEELGMTIVMVTHNSSLAAKADRQLFVKDGRIQ